MRFSDIFIASLVAPLVSAHGGDIPGAPRIFGMPRQLKARNPLVGHQEAGMAIQGPKLQTRQGGNKEGRCGTQGGGASCAAGFCCSSEGYCGNGIDYCAAPDCQINFGPGCDANKTPAGASTRNDARPQLGNIAYGGLGIRSCLKPNTVAITYDDGPYIYTEQVMAQFEARNAHATFFVTGNNIGKGAIDEKWQSVIQHMYNKGHQIASHTWGHQDLSLITQQQRYDQMVRNEMAIRNIIGKYPTYMRPPYSSCNDACQGVLEELGYVVTSFDLDTDDYRQLSKEKIQTAKDNFKKGIDGGNRLSIEHDIHELTALNLTGYMLDYVYSHGLTAVTVGECMNDPPANWYRDSTPASPGSGAGSATSSGAVPTPTGSTSNNGACGIENTAGGGQSCIGFVAPDGLLGECCSQYGWCGSGSDYCVTGCNPLFGRCGTQPSVAPPVTLSPPASTAVAVSQTSQAAQPTTSSSAVVTPTPTPVASSTIATVVRPSSAATSSAKPAPTAAPVSKNGRCGSRNGGQTCAGYKNFLGWGTECCSKTLGMCTTDPWGCGPGCDKAYGNCWF